MTTRRTPTTEEAIAIRALQRVTFPVASWDKRFSHQLQPDAISEKEAPQVWRLFYRYRRQIYCERKNELLAIAQKLAAPDFRKLQAQARDQERINEQRRRYQEAMQQKPS